MAATVDHRTWTSRSWSAPCTCKISYSSSNYHRNTQVEVVGHEDQHEQIADGELNRMQTCLSEVHFTENWV